MNLSSFDRNKIKSIMKKKFDDNQNLKIILPFYELSKICFSEKHNNTVIVISEQLYNTVDKIYPYLFSSPLYSHYVRELKCKILRLKNKKNIELDVVVDKEFHYANALKYNESNQQNISSVFLYTIDYNI